MTKFKVGDKVKVLSDSDSIVPVGSVGIVSVERDGLSVYVHFSGIHGLVTGQGHCTDSCWLMAHAELQLIEENNMKYEQGQILVDGSGNRYKILGVCGEVYLLSYAGGHRVFEACYTQYELDNKGYHLESDTPTIQIEGKTYNKQAVLERLEGLEEV